MSPDNHRHERVGEEIAHEINVMLAGELKDPRLEVSVIVSEVRVQPDMKHARVFVAVPHTTNKEQTDAIKALEHASGFIRRELVEHSPRVGGKVAIAPRPGSALYAGPFSGTRRAHRTAAQGSEKRETSKLRLSALGARQISPACALQRALQKEFLAARRVASDRSLIPDY